MTNTTRGQIFLMGAVAAILVAGSSPAIAGFEWKGAPPAPSVAAPVLDVGTGPMISAVPIEPVITSPADNIVWGNDVNAPASLVPQGTKKATDVVTGFGSDLPLSVALQQVVPASYKVSLAPGVRGDTSVSWSGDKPWGQVLTQMLSAHNLAYTLEGNTVTVNAVTKKAAAKQASANKLDMIPDDMISSGEKEETWKTAPAVAPGTIPTDGQAPIVWASTPVMAPPATDDLPPPAPGIAPPPPSKPVSVTIRRDRPVPLLEKNIEPVGEIQAVHEDITAARETAPQLSAQASAAPAQPTVVEPSWRATKGQTLHGVLEDWSKAAHVELYWSTDYDYRLNETVAYGGNYNAAVGKLLDRFSVARPQPYGRLHRNPEGSTVLVVNTYDTSN